MGKCRSFWTPSVVVILLLVLTACGGDSDSDSDSGSGSADPTPGPGRGNRLSIAGVASSGVNPGDSYAFQPRVTGHEGRPLSFEILNKPSWTQFDQLTGRVTGVPQDADIGATIGIVIRVSDGTATAQLPPFNVYVETLFPGVIALDWLPPTANVDGSPVDDLAGYRVYYGIEYGRYTEVIDIDDPNNMSHIVDNLPPNLYYFVATAYDATGFESAFSNAVMQWVF